MNEIDVIASLISEDPNSIFSAQSQNTIDQNAQRNDTSNVNYAIDKNQKQTEQAAKNVEKAAQRYEKQLKSQQAKLRSSVNKLGKSNIQQADDSQEAIRAIDQIAKTLGQASSTKGV